MQNSFSQFKTERQFFPRPSCETLEQINTLYKYNKRAASRLAICLLTSSQRFWTGNAQISTVLNGTSID